MFLIFQRALLLLAPFADPSFYYFKLSSIKTKYTVLLFLIPHELITDSSSKILLL